MKLLALTVLAVVIAATSASAESVGFRDIQVEVGGETLVTALWYPTDAAPGQTTIGPFTMAASRGTPVGEGRYGLILLSHGTGGGRLNHRGTAIRLAEAGYIVAAPEHAGDSWRDGRFSGTSANWHRRPRQLGAVLDRLLDDPEFGRHIDAARIGAVGHSAGGYSVLALIGGRADMALLARHCTERRSKDPEFCAYGRAGEPTGSQMPDLGDARVDGPTGGPMPDLGDGRVGAVVAVAPVGALFGAGAFAGVDVPAQIHRLGGDRVLRRPWHAVNVATLLGESAELVVHREAHHFAFISPFPPALVGRVGPPAHDPAGFDRRAFLAGIDAQIVRFFEDALPAP